MNTTNPFTARAKKKPNPFAAKAKAKKVNGHDKPNPFAKKAKTASSARQAKERKDAIERAEAKAKEYEAALDLAAKKFKKVDRLDTPRKRETQAFGDAKEEWLSAERQVDILFNALTGALAVAKRYTQ